MVRYHHDCPVFCYLRFLAVFLTWAATVKYLISIERMKRLEVASSWMDSPTIKSRGNDIELFYFVRNLSRDFNDVYGVKTICWQAVKYIQARSRFRFIMWKSCFCLESQYFNKPLYTKSTKCCVCSSTRIFDRIHNPGTMQPGSFITDNLDFRRRHGSPLSSSDNTESQWDQDFRLVILRFVVLGLNGVLYDLDTVISLFLCCSLPMLLQHPGSL